MKSDEILVGKLIVVYCNGYVQTGDGCPDDRGDCKFDDPQDAASYDMEDRCEHCWLDWSRKKAKESEEK